MTTKANTKLATLLDTYMKRASLGEARLATLVNSINGNPNFIHRSTLRNWRDGSSQKINNWRQLATVAAALHLSEEETNALLENAGCPRIRVLEATALKSDQALLNYWPRVAEPLDYLTTPQQTNRPQLQSAELVAVSNATTSLNRFFPAFSKRFSKLPLAGVCLIALLCVAIAGYWAYQNKNDSIEHAGPENLLVNSSFEDGTGSWSSYVNDAAMAAFKVEHETMRIDIEQTGEENWHIQLFQHNFEVTAQTFYTLSFRVRGDGATSMKVDVTRAMVPSTTLGFDNSIRQLIEPTDQWSVKTIEFEANETVLMDEGGARVLFDIGKSKPGYIELDDIKLIKGGSNKH